MTHRKGFTLMEIMIVLIIISVCIALFVPNFFPSIQQSYAQVAKNNLLSIYSAEQNYNNNNGSYCLSTNNGTSTCQATITSPDTVINTSCAGTLGTINCNLSLNIQDTTFTYSCSNGACTAIALGGAPSGINWTLNLSAPTVMSGANANPACTGTNCPT